LKAFISQCRLFIGARTHATIAAYSSNVPALALGYSVKARGIARDIFGDEKGLVLPIQELSSARKLIDAFNELREREGDLRRRLEEVMPGYVKHAHLAIEEVRALL
jgi:polysaccharide pyruvyl transferase WcaK-like protein